VRNLDQDTSAVAGLRIATTGATVRQIQEHLYPIANDVVALFAADTGHEPDSAGIMLMRRIVQTLRGRDAIHMPYAGHRGFS
jgi:hypothetical protein